MALTAIAAAIATKTPQAITRAQRGHITLLTEASGSSLSKFMTSPYGPINAERFAAPLEQAASQTCYTINIQR